MELICQIKKAANIETGKFQDKFVESCYEAQESFRLRARRCAPESRCRKVDAAFSVIHS